LDYPKYRGYKQIDAPFDLLCIIFMLAEFMGNFADSSGGMLRKIGVDLFI
jgi:hypothetical protein